MGAKDEQPAKDINAITAKPFAQMTATEKVRHVGKVLLFLLTFGFAYPNVLSD